MPKVSSSAVRWPSKRSSSTETCGFSPSVTLSSNDTWISLSGQAQIVDDEAKAKELWNGWVQAWLPQGPSDPSVVLIKVEGDTAEYWDTPGGRIASVLSFAKAKVTGKRYEGGENEVVDLD